MKKYRCVLCGKEVEGYGNNPAPLAQKGKCCKDCFMSKVLPKRMEDVFTLTVAMEKEYDRRSKIERMARVMSEAAFADTEDKKSKHFAGLSGFYAEACIKAGYGDMKAFSEHLKSLFSESGIYFGKDVIEIIAATCEQYLDEVKK